MNDSTSNDNDMPGIDKAAPGPDAHGQAAILLVESLIHGLIARSVLSVGEAVEIVNVAREVKQEFADEMGEPRGIMEHSLAILDAIHASLSIDLPADDDRPWAPRR